MLIGDRADAHLDARSVVEIEAAQVDVVADALAVLVVDEEAGGSGEHLARLLARRGLEELALDADVAEAARRRPADAAHLDDLRVVLVGLVAGERGGGTGAGVGVGAGAGAGVGVGAGAWNVTA